MEVDQAELIKRLEALGFQFVPKTQKSNDARIKAKVMTRITGKSLFSGDSRDTNQSENQS